MKKTPLWRGRGSKLLAREAGVVKEITGQRPGATEVSVWVGGRLEKAVNYDPLTGPVRPGDRVVLNTTAVRLGLGTGGYHFVIHVLGRDERALQGSGYLMKARYTPCQVRCQGVEEDPRYVDRIHGFRSLDGMPVVVGELHSQVAAVAAGFKAWAPGQCRLVYVMTDGAALPAAFSRTIPLLKNTGLVEAVVTAGHAFGGDLEAVNIYTALIAAKEVLDAACVVVAMGPGIVGTGTRYGFTGIEQGEIINTAAVLGGQPVAVVRMSFADPRPRHRGISHHTLTSLTEVALKPARVVLPRLTGSKGELVKRQVSVLHDKGIHLVVEGDGQAGLDLLDGLGLRVTTMGRTVQEDLEFFLAASAAGEAAAEMVRSRGRGQFLR